MQGEFAPQMTSRRAFLRQAAGLSLGLPLLAACGPSAPSVAPTAKPAAGAPPAATSVGVSTPAPAAAAKPQPKSGGTIRAATVGEYVNIDGHYYSPRAGLSHWMLYDTLTRYDDQLKPQPMLAESWEHSSDLRQLKLNLRKGVTFHSGREFTSEDAVYNLERVRDPKVTAGIQTGFIPPNTTWEAPDKYTVVIKTQSPWAAVFDFLEVVGILDEATMEGPDAKSKAVGTGPFSFVEWVQGSHLSFTKNKNYWESGRPYLDGIHISIMRDQQSMVAGLEAGSLDMAQSPALPDFARLRNDPRFTPWLFPNTPSFIMIQPNSTLQPLTDKRVRQAFNYTIDRARMRDNVLVGIGETKALPWAPGSPAYEPEKNNHFAFNLDKAKQLLQEAGVSTPLDLEMVFNSQNAEQAAMSQIWQSDLQKIGVNLSLRGLESAVLLPMWHNQTYKGFYIAADAWTNLQPITFFTSSSVARVSGNNGGYKSDAYTEKVNALATEADETKRKQMLSELNDFLLDESIVYPVATAGERLLTTNKVKDIGYRRIPLFKFTDTWLDA
jgi:peptide/nickel transport system substrate-binding protein